MAAPNTKKFESDRSILKPLIITIAVLVLVGIGLLISHKAQQPDPTMTAAPPVAHPVHLPPPPPRRWQKNKPYERRQMHSFGL
jgi:cell division protein FtsN